MKLFKTLITLFIGFSTLNLLTMAPLSPRPTKALDLSKLSAQEAPLQEYTPRLAPLTVNVTNKDFFQITLQVEYAQPHRCADLPPLSPYVYHKIEGAFKSIKIVRQQKNGRLKQLLGITLFHDEAGTFTLSEQECATMSVIQILLRNNKFEKTTII